MMGDVFREKREAAGLSQKEAAGRMFVSQPMLNQVEAGIKVPGVKMIRAAAELFECSSDEFIFWDKKQAG